jgi:hypothetical protein
MLDDPMAYAGDGGLGAALAAAADAGADLSPHGERRAVAAFRAVAHPAPVSTTLMRTPVMTRITRKIAAAPVAALAAAGIVLAGGGLAFAASQGAVHVPFTGHDSRPADAPTASATVNPGVAVTHSPSDEASDASPDASATASPSPSLEGLCVAFQAGAMDKAASNPAFTALQNAAGGTDNVDAYCVGLIGASTHPTAPTHPARPTRAATPHAGPAATPTHPARPTSVPTADVPEEPSRAVTH